MHHGNPFSENFRISRIIVIFTAITCCVLLIIFTRLIRPYELPHKNLIAFLFLAIALSMVGLVLLIARQSAEKDKAHSKKENKDYWNEAHLRALLNAAPDAIFITDGTGTIHIANALAEKWFGYRKDEFVGKKVEMLVPEHLRQAHVEHRNRYNQNPSTRIMASGTELVGIRSDGSEFPMEVSLSPSMFGGELWITASVRDITLRKEMELAKLHAQTRLSELVTNLPVGVFRICDSDLAHFQEVNPAMVTIFAAQSASQLLASSLESLFFDHKDWSTYTARMAQQFHLNSLEFRFRRLNGEDFFGFLTIAANTINGETVYDGILEDITERKQQSERIGTLNKDLERRKTQLEQINQELESFSYSVSHDLRAPLRAMDGFSSTLLTDYQDQLDERGRDRLLRIRSAAQRMATLIDDLLNLSRVSRTEIAWTPANLSELANGIINDLRQANPERKMEVKIQPDMQVKGDVRLLGIALTNLFNNAWKFSGKTSNATIEFGCERQNDQTVYFLRDNGAGFEMEYAGKLFGAFQRLHDIGEFPGSGIGLATVQRIIHKHGGRVWATGEVNKGATFYFTLKS